MGSSVVEFLTKNPSRGTDDRITLETGRCRTGGQDNEEDDDAIDDRAATWSAMGEHPPLAITHHLSIARVVAPVVTCSWCAIRSIS